MYTSFLEQERRKKQTKPEIKNKGFFLGGWGVGVMYTGEFLRQKFICGCVLLPLVKKMSNKKQKS